MKTIFIFLTTILLLFSSSVSAQTSEDVEKRVLKYLENLTDKDYDTFFNLLAPAYKKYMPKEFIVNTLFKVDNDERFTNQIVGFEIINVFEPVIHNDTAYIKVDYKAERNLIYTSEASDDFIRKINTKFEESQKDDFKYISSERKMITFRPGCLIMCLDINTNTYCFMFYDVKLYPYMHFFMPQEVVDELFK